MTHASRTRSRLEIALWFVGVSLIGFASGATFARWNYQEQQERALFAGGPAVSAPAFQVALAPQTFTDTFGPPAPGTTPEPVVQRVAVEKKVRPPRLDPSAIGRIEIPRLGLAAIVREGADESTLSRAVGLVPGTAHPGEIGNMVLAGHRDTFFRPLRKIKVSDRIRLVVPPNTYEYVVQSLRVVEPHETSVLASRGSEELTLVTCYPFRFIGPSPDRFIVTATRVN